MPSLLVPSAITVVLALGETPQVIKSYAPRSFNFPHPIQHILPASMVVMAVGDSVRARIVVIGLVQGVAYRAFTQRAASQLGLRGGVRNLDDGRVAVEAEGARGVVERLIEMLRTGPPMARVQDVRVQWEPATGQYADFRIWY